jgi:cation:H+ antiporter
MDAVTIAQLLAGLVLLVAGGELLVRGASRLGRSMGMSPLLVGLTIVAFATSAPELAVTVDASLSGNPGIAVGNVVGSNIVNVLLILGVSAVVLPLVVRSQLVRADVPIMVGFTLLLLVLALDGSVSRAEGVLLIALMVGYVVFAVALSRRSAPVPTSSDARAEATFPHHPVPWSDVSDVSDVSDDPRHPVWQSLLFVAVGVAMLVLGARWLVAGATDIAEAAGVSDVVIGLTVVAVGTSLPELASSVVAALRGERDIAVGNIVGSNIFNIGAVMGIAALVSPGGVPVASSIIRFDLPVALAVAVALVPVVFTGFAIARWEGALFVAYFVAYVTYLVLDAQGHDALPAFSLTMLVFAVPITALSLAVLVGYEVGLKRGRTGAPVPPA